MRVTTTYQKQTIQRKATYHCNCGNKFYRVNSDWFTINPYNTKTPAELVKELSIKLDNKPELVIGERYALTNPTRYLLTSTVTEIISETENETIFKTKNSTYKIITNV